MQTSRTPPTGLGQLAIQPPFVSWRVSALPLGRALDTSSGPRFPGARLLRWNVGDETEFVSVTFFDTLDAVRGFAGDDYETAGGEHLRVAGLVGAIPADRKHPAAFVDDLDGG